MNRSGGFDAEAFYAALDAERQHEELTWKEVAAEAGISASTLTRMKQGKRPDVDSMAALASWARLDVDTFIDRGDQGEERAVLPQISALLRADPSLDPESATAIEEVIRVAYEHLRRAASGAR